MYRSGLVPVLRRLTVWSVTRLGRAAVAARTSDGPRWPLFGRLSACRLRPFSESVDETGGSSCILSDGMSLLSAHRMACSALELCCRCPVAGLCWLRAATWQAPGGPRLVGRACHAAIALTRSQLRKCGIRLASLLRHHHCSRQLLQRRIVLTRLIELRRYGQRWRYLLRHRGHHHRRIPRPSVGVL